MSAGSGPDAGPGQMPETIADILNEKYWEDGDDAHWYDVTGGEGDAFLRVSFDPLCVTLEPTFGMRPMEKEAVLRAADMIRRIEVALSAGEGTEGGAVTYGDDRTAGAMGEDERREYVRKAGAAMTASQGLGVPEAGR